MSGLGFEGFIASALIVFLTASLILRSRWPWIPVWSIMMFTSFIAVASGLIAFDEVGRHIDLNVIFFLIGMFSIVSLANSSGLLDFLAYVVVSKLKSRWSAIITSSLLFGLMAAFLVNDSVALLGPPIAFFISKVANVDPEMMCLLLMFSLTVGSVMTPIGNPQNMLIAVESGMDAPFIYFIARLAIPTLLNLILTPLILIKIYNVKNVKLDSTAMIPQEMIRNRRDALLSGLGLAATVAGIVVNDVFALIGLPHVTERGFIPLLVASALYIFASKPRKVLEGVDWGTILFFIGMFITMDAIWSGGVLQEVLPYIHAFKSEGLIDIYAITVASLTLSQLLSNVPFTKLYITYMRDLGYSGTDITSWLTLATSSTIAGNLTLLGAASNIIVLEALESKYGRTVSFVKFLKVGSVVTVANVLTYIPFLALNF